ncbi:helix-turn-helix domain-containing protein [Collinsella sp. SGI.033]|uniref:helix-turn-helix domain-containing protein n=2 Tax=unclassified Collinsella TaxID=2637548 RepID=UPI003D074CC8
MRLRSPYRHCGNTQTRSIPKGLLALQFVLAHFTTGEKIRYYRKLRGLYQGELGEKIGVSKGAIRHYETDFRTPKQPQVEAIAEALDNSPLACWTSGQRTPETSWASFCSWRTSSASCLSRMDQAFQSMYLPRRRPPLPGLPQGLNVHKVDGQPPQLDPRPQPRPASHVPVHLGESMPKAALDHGLRPGLAHGLGEPAVGGERGPDLPELGRPAPEGPPAAAGAIDGLHGHLFRKGF